MHKITIDLNVTSNTGKAIVWIKLCFVSVLAAITAVQFSGKLTMNHIILLLILLSLLYFVWARPKFRILALVFSIPLTVASYYVGFTFKLWMLVMGIALAQWYFQLAFNRSGVSKDILSLLIVLLFIINVVSMYNAINVMRSFRMLIQYSLLFMLTLYVVNNITSENMIRYALRCILGTGIIIIVYGIVQWIGNLNGYDIKLPMENYSLYSNDVASGLKIWMVSLGNYRIPRIRGPFPDPNIYGSYILSFLPLLISMTIHTIREGRNRVLFISASFLGIIAIIATASRTAIVGAVISIIFLVFFWKKALLTRKMIRVILVSSMLIPLVIFMIPQKTQRYLNPALYLERIIATFQVNDESTVLHRQLALYAFEMWRKHPIIGVGFGNYGSYLDPGSAGNASSHTAVLSFFAETGLVGGILNLIIVMVLIIILMKNIKSSEKYSYWFAVNVGLLASYFITIVGNITYNYYNEAYIWFMMGIIISIDKMRRQKNKVDVFEGAQ